MASSMNADAMGGVVRLVGEGLRQRLPLVGDAGEVLRDRDILGGGVHGRTPTAYGEEAPPVRSALRRIQRLRPYGSAFGAYAAMFTRSLR